MTFATKPTRSPAAFTLIELLVVIGIIALLAGILLPAVNLAYKRANAARTRYDLQAIATALDAYSADFAGSYPLVNGTNRATGNYEVGTGAHVLCQALFGLGPAYPESGVGADGADGPGFRLRRTIDDGLHQAYTETIPAYNGAGAVPPAAIGTKTANDGTADSFGGRVYGPYLAAENWHFDTVGPLAAMDKVRILDRSGNPILYYPALSPKVNLATNTAPLLAWTYDPSKPTDAYTHGALTVSSKNYRPLFNANDNVTDQAGVNQVGLGQVAVMLGDSNADGVIGPGETAPPVLPYLLWSEGADGKWGCDVSGDAAANAASAAKCDDVTNFRD